MKLERRTTLVSRNGQQIIVYETILDSVYVEYK